MERERDGWKMTLHFSSRVRGTLGKLPREREDGRGLEGSNTAVGGDLSAIYCKVRRNEDCLLIRGEQLTSDKAKVSMKICEKTCSVI